MVYYFYLRVTNNEKEVSETFSNKHQKECFGHKAFKIQWIKVADQLFLFISVSDYNFPKFKYLMSQIHFEHFDLYLGSTETQKWYYHYLKSKWLKNKSDTDILWDFHETMSPYSLYFHE